MKELTSSIKQNGIKDAVVLTLTQGKDRRKVSVYLSEGNHRLAVAKQLGIVSMLGSTMIRLD